MDNASQLTQVFLADSQEGLERMEKCLTELELRPHDSELVAEIFRTVHTIKGGTGFLGLHRMEALAHAGEQALGALRDGERAVTPRLIGVLLELLDGLRAILYLIETTGGEGTRATDDDSDLIALLREDHRSGAQPGKTREAVCAPKNSTDRTLRVDVEVLNRMMNLVGELVLTRNQILQSRPGAENFNELAVRLDNVTADLREVVMEARMQPVGNIFDRYTRMVRDLGQTCGRSVRIEFEGQETGLDKSLLEAIKDPLTHAVRNAVDHGIEPPEERIKAGKPAEGLLRLRAYQQNGSVVIEVTDDGAGISTKRVLAKAVERGLLTEDRAAEMTDSEATQLIFAPGFSTAEKITHISGRGVGLDVVRANVEKVGGTVEVDSIPGVGTTLRLRVPLTLAIVPALIVRSGEQSFALPQSALLELVYVPRAEAVAAVEHIGSAELYRLRGQMLPLLRLDRLLGLVEGAHDLDVQGFYIAVLEAEACRFGMVVDDLLAPEEIVVKPISRVLREIGLFSGATVLGNGLLSMILDVAAVGARVGMRPIAEVERRSAEPEQHLEQAEATSMVVYEVDDRSGAGTPGRMAMPMSAVERIECVPIERIEYAGGMPLLQYRGELLPLDDASGVLQRQEAHGGLATVLICMKGTPGAMRRVGVVVRRVLDISGGTLLPIDERLGEGQVAMVKDRVTTVHCEFAGLRSGTDLNSSMNRGPVEPRTLREVA